jgi:hypothetical protein
MLGQVEITPAVVGSSSIVKLAEPIFDSQGELMERERTVAMVRSRSELADSAWAGDKKRNDSRLTTRKAPPPT